MTLHELSRKEIAPALKKELKLKNIFEAPRLQKISVNVGLGEIKGNEALQKSIENGLGLITGQKPVKTSAKKAIAAFKLREDDHIGYRVTLRGKRMYDFLDRLITFVFPRIRDFQGFPAKGFDKKGNFSFGLKDQMVFPELPYQTNNLTWGMQITLVSTAKNDQRSRTLLETMRFPLAKNR